MRKVLGTTATAVLALAKAVAIPAGTVAASAGPAVVPFASQAPDDPAGTAAAGVPPACTSPSPMHTYAYYHCFGPNEVRAAHGLPPLTSTSQEGAGQTIVLVDSY